MAVKRNQPLTLEAITVCLVHQRDISNIVFAPRHYAMHPRNAVALMDKDKTGEAQACRFAILDSCVVVW